MEDRSRILRLHPGCPDRPRRHVPEQRAMEDGDEGIGEVTEVNSGEAKI